MKLKLAAIALACVASAAFAAPQTLELDSSHTQPYFEIGHFGYSNQMGRFEKATGTVVVDLEKKTGSLDVSIDTNSLSTGWAARDKHLKTADFFNVEKFPAMTFKSTDFKFDGDKLVAVNGNFTLLGVTKPLTLNISNFHCGDHPMMKKFWCGAEATATIKRSDFGMTTFVPAVSDEVKLTIPVEAGAK
ncbi:YceI family protein [Silvimonas iriomotensis]|uniref:Polyisoprenoid-binding protein n=1 Tax=Silvimonas iriomotensis TaxID=449662 RepID=A0ABQ2P7X6_9NEIS|nr:YceI family protein [Silvimonas iriomotensis]GGP20604.1 polyisoprenoid-binding protein [Silvimonas iriomotensis]